ncbi:MAG: hypothetical protein AAFU73_10895 [Planctomycetota bacterium]
MDDEHALGTPLPQQAWPGKEHAVEEYRSLRQEIKDRIKSIQLTFAGAIAISITAFLRILGEVEFTGRDDLPPAFLSIIPIGLLSASSYSIRSQYYDIWRNAAYIRVFFERRGEPGANWEQRQAGFIKVRRGSRVQQPHGSRAMLNVLTFLGLLELAVSTTAVVVSGTTTSSGFTTPHRWLLTWFLLLVAAFCVTQRRFYRDMEKRRRNEFRSMLRSFRRVRKKERKKERKRAARLAQSRVSPPVLPW